MSDKIFAIVVAAGKGERFGSDVPKQYCKLGGKRVVSYSLERFVEHKKIDGVVLVVNSAHKQYYKDLGVEHVVIGGDLRQESVFKGLQYLRDLGDVSKVLIHDGARPFLETGLISDLLKGLEKSDGVIPVVNIVDSLRRNSNPQSREGLVKVQTPQAFDFESVLQAHEKCKGKSFTDDACVFEENGGSVLEVQGREENFKITTREDLERAEIILNGKMEYRVGKGIDVHRFSDEKFADGGVIIGGIKIKHDKNIIAHSDGDVLIHALVDALLGSVGEGDIGDFFPPSDDEFKDMDSEIFLKKACDVLKEKNAKIVNVDLTILAERPKITPHKEMIKKNLARILEIEESRVSVKATTTEKLGFVGREEGIAAEAIVNIKII